MANNNMKNEKSMNNASEKAENQNQNNAKSKSLNQAENQNQNNAKNAKNEAESKTKN